MMRVPQASARESGQVARSVSSDSDAGPLVLLTEIARALESATSPREAVDGALALLETHTGARGVALVRSDREHRSVSVEVARGDGAALRPRFGRGVAGRVADSGRPIVVPRVAREPMALEELGRRELSGDATLGLVSVPVPLGQNAGAALSIYFDGAHGDDPEDRLRLLQVVASQLAHRLGDGTGHTSAAPSSVAATDVPFECANMIGSSAVMRQVYEQIGQVAGTNATVLVRGESGTGKELIAEAIHGSSARERGPFVRVNCAALPETLFESELFGHERGAFTGALSRKLGRFELARGGTIFLDEVGELPLSTQVKLLRVLQAREFERIGGTETIAADVRLIAATNRDLEAGVSDGTFREDLYYRLNVFSITVPPLRERQGDIALLAEFFVETYASQHARRIRRLSPAALDVLARHGWPGNVRELENAIERAVVVCDGSTIEPRHLPDSVRCGEPARPGTAQTLGEAVEQLERWMIEQALRGARGNLARAARDLGATERVLRYKANKYRIDAARYRS